MGAGYSPELRSNFQPPLSQRKGYHNIFLDIIVPFKTPGEYCFYINVDGHELGSLPFSIVSIRRLNSIQDFPSATPKRFYLTKTINMLFPSSIIKCCT